MEVTVAHVLGTGNALVCTLFREDHGPREQVNINMVLHVGDVTEPCSCVEIPNLCYVTRMPVTLCNSDVPRNTYVRVSGCQVARTTHACAPSLTTHKARVASTAHMDSSPMPIFCYEGSKVSIMRQGPRS